MYKVTFSIMSKAVLKLGHFQIDCVTTYEVWNIYLHLVAL